MIGGLLAGARGASGAPLPPAGVQSVAPIVPLACPASCVRTLLLVVALSHDEPMQVLLPEEPDCLFGVVSPRATREAAVAVASSLASALPVPGLPLRGVFLPAFETVPLAGDVSLSVDRIVALPWQIRGALPLGRGWRWASLALLAGCAALYELVVFAFSRVASYRPSTSTSVLFKLLELRARRRTGARALSALARASGSAKEGGGRLPLSWAGARARTLAADELLKRALLSYSEGDEREIEHVRSFADRVLPAAEDDIPPQFRVDGALPSFSNPALFGAPFSVRVQPPRTVWLTAQRGQPRVPAGFLPACFLDLLLPTERGRFRSWCDDFRGWLVRLCDAAALSDEGALAALLKARPKAFVLSQSGLVPEARGIIWDCRGDHPVPLDLAPEPDTHLNLDSVRELRASWPTWPDQELFAHLLEGARYKSAPVEHLLLQPHLTSLPRALLNTHRELARLVKLSFFEVFWSPPFLPWNTFPMGAVFRKLEPDRPRRTTDGGAPRKGQGRALSFVDSDGKRVIPINVQSKWPAEDLARGTTELFYQQWEIRLGVSRSFVPPAFTPVLPPGSAVPRPRSLPPAVKLRVLILFAGPGKDLRRLAVFLREAGVDVVEMDLLLGGEAHDVTRAEVFEPLMRRIAMGDFAAVFAAPPCATFSVAHDPVLRRCDDGQIEGVQGLPDEWKAHVKRHTSIARRTGRLLQAAHQQGLLWLCENPSFRGEKGSPAFWEDHLHHGALWCLDVFKDLANSAGVDQLVFAQCELGAVWQKYTTLLGSTALIDRMPQLKNLKCGHARHVHLAKGRRGSGESLSQESAAYPPLMNAVISDAIVAELQAVSGAGRASHAVALRDVSARGALPNQEVVDIDITRHGSILELQNPFKFGPNGRELGLAPLSVATYEGWLAARVTRAGDYPSALPVSVALAHLRGGDVDAALQALVDKYGAEAQYNLLHSKREGDGVPGHGAVLKLLLENMLSGAGKPPWPRELKITVSEIMNDLSVLMHLSYLTGEPVFQITSDVKDFFNQHYLARSEWNKGGLLTLDLEAMVGDLSAVRAAHPHLVYIAEYVLGFGLSPNSNICQRHAHLLIFAWLVAMEKAAEPVVRALRQRYPAVNRWVEWRAQHLEPAAANAVDPCLRIRFAQARLWTASCYTDDAHLGALGVRLSVLALREWYRVTKRLNLTMAIVLKHEIGQCVKTQGCVLHTGLGLAYVPADKLRRTVAELLRVTADPPMPLRDYQSLVGLLQSLLFLTSLRRSATFGLYTPFAGLVEIDPEELLRATPLILRQVAEWLRVLCTKAGCSLEAGVPLSRGADALRGIEAPAVFFLRSDACKTGAEFPGLGAALGGKGWRFPDKEGLSEAHLSLPIAVTEFAAAFGAIVSFGDEVPEDCLVVLEVDALSTADALATEAASSPLMQHVYLRLCEHPTFMRVKDRLLIAHVHGERNVISDAWSRGKFQVLKQLCAQLGLAFQTVDSPAELGTLLDELVQVQAARASEATRPRSADDRSQSRQVRQRPATEAELGIGGPFSSDRGKDGPGALQLYNAHFLAYPSSGIGYVCQQRETGPPPLSILAWEALYSLWTDARRRAEGLLQLEEVNGAQRRGVRRRLRAVALDLLWMVQPTGPCPPPFDFFRLDGSLDAPPSCMLSSELMDCLRARPAHLDFGVTGKLLFRRVDPQSLHATALALRRANNMDRQPFAHVRLAKPVGRVFRAWNGNLDENIERMAPVVTKPSRRPLPSMPGRALPVPVISSRSSRAGVIAPQPTGHEGVRVISKARGRLIDARRLTCEDGSARREMPRRSMAAAPHALVIADMLMADQSALALRPTEFALADLCYRLYDSSTAQAASTTAGQRSAWKHWTAWCAKMNTDPWRSEHGGTPTDQHREAVLQAGFLQFCHNRQSARNGRLAALPSSATKTLAHIRKLHRDRGCPMVSSALVNTESRRLHYEYRSQYGVQAMVPKRKEPFTKQMLISHVLGAPAGLDLGGGWSLDWSSRAGKSLAALTAVLAQTGFRKSEVSVPSQLDTLHYCLQRSHLHWVIQGVPVDRPTAAQLRQLRAGDFAVLTPPPSKSDPFDMVWGGNPIWLPFVFGEPLCAAIALADLLLAWPTDGAVDSAVFTHDDGKPFTGSQLDKALERMLLHAYPPATVRLYSWHSARIFLCTSLLEAGASRAQIQALCRWQTEDSIAVYGRLSAASYSALITAAMGVSVTTARAHNLMHAAPFVDQHDVALARAACAAEHDNAHLDADIDPTMDADEPDELAGSPAGPPDTPLTARGIPV